MFCWAAEIIVVVGMFSLQCRAAADDSKECHSAQCGFSVLSSVFCLQEHLPGLVSLVEQTVDSPVEQVEVPPVAPQSRKSTKLESLRSAF